MKKIIIFIVTIGLFGACEGRLNKNVAFKDNINESLKNYWYNGLAELSNYELEQARYGEIRKGNAVLIFVTEDFLVDQQVKADDPGNSKSTSVLKMNFVKKFPTGIYDYSMLLSAFTPINSSQYPHTLKVSCSAQEWCGHVFSQLNLRKEEYLLTEFSYFEKEGDRKIKLPIHILEDELWNRIRCSPNLLPVGDVTLIPGQFQSRLRHIPLKAEKTFITKDSIIDKNLNLVKYTIKYSESNRTLTIYYHQEFPHIIEKWEETYKDGFGEKSNMLTTRAQRLKTIRADYWKMNTVADSMSYINFFNSK